MELLPMGFTLEIPSGGFPLSTDSMVLSHFVRLPPNSRILDLGSGCGTLGILLCARDPNCRVTGFELSQQAHLAAVENIRRNDLSGRMNSICADLRRLPSLVSPGSFDVCVSNPPYFSGGPASRDLPTARREDSCSAADLMRSAGHALKFGGDFFLVHRPERMADLIARASGFGMEAKRLLLVRHRPSSPVSIIVLQFRKGGKPGLKIEEATLFREDHSPTPFYCGVYHISDPTLSTTGGSQ